MNAEATPGSVRGPASGLRILLVEDEPANRALIRAILERARRDLGEVLLHEAATIADARSILATEPLDVVLVDVRLPDGNGLALAADIGARPGERRPRVVVVSASVLPAERSTALAAGADEFLGKPFGARDLIDLLLRTPGDG